MAKQESVKITLDEEFICFGAFYGPGEVEIEDPDIARRLTAANEHVRKLRGKTSVPVKPNALIVGPSATMDETAPVPNGLTPEQIEAQRNEQLEQQAELEAKTSGGRPMTENERPPAPKRPTRTKI